MEYYASGTPIPEVIYLTTPFLYFRYCYRIMSYRTPNLLSYVQFETDLSTNVHSTVNCNR